MLALSGAVLQGQINQCLLSSAAADAAAAELAHVARARTRSDACLHCLGFAGRLRWEAGRQPQHSVQVARPTDRPTDVALRCVGSSSSGGCGGGVLQQ